MIRIGTLVLALLCLPAAFAQTTRPAAGTWSIEAPMPEARTEVAAAADGRQMFVIGGYVPGLSLSRAMYVYGPARDRWSSPTAIPEGISHTALVHLGGKLYIIGGWRGTNVDATGALQIYDIAAARWSAGAPMPTARAAHAAVVLDGRIHVLGGHAQRAQQLDSREHGVGSDRASVGTHEVYDPATDTWKRFAPMPTPRNHVAAVVVEGRIHTLGGRVGNDFTMTTHEIYDPANDSWHAGPPLLTGRSGMAAAELNGRIYVFGGEASRPVHKTFSEAERFDPRTGRWQALPPMPTARHGLGAAALGGAVHVVAGGPQPGASFSGVHEVFTPSD